MREVRLEVGPLSGVEPELLSIAFDRLRGDTASTATAQLFLDEVPLEARCVTCSQVFQPQAFRFHCPTCGGFETEITRGDGVLLESVLLDDAA